jgi:putative nonproteinogenic amino acid hydroxylase
MNSRILTTLPIDDALLARDLEEIARFPIREEYSEYSFGAWRSFVLANGSGDHEDMRFRTFPGACSFTQLGERVPYLRELITRHFRPDGLKWVRLFTVQDGLLVSHRDFIEFNHSFWRVHVPLKTDLTCLHSEENDVFHMRRGEVWFLDATTIHSACSLSGFQRVSLCLDFEADALPLEQVLRPGALPPADPFMISRPPLDARQHEALRGLRGLADKANFRQLIRLLGAVHFYRQAHAGAMFDWLQEIYQDDPALSAKAAAYRRFCIERRAFAERFEL